MKKLISLVLISFTIFILFSSFVFAAEPDILIIPETVLGGTVLIPGSINQKIGAVELTANVEIASLVSFGLSINNPGIQSLKIVDEFGRQFGYIQGTVSVGQIYKFYAPNGNYPPRMMAGERRIFNFFADVQNACTGIVQPKLEEVGAVNKFGITATTSPLPITLPGISTGNAELNVSLSPNHQPNLVVGGYNMAGKYIISAINGDIFIREISVKMEGDIANIRDVSLRPSTTMTGNLTVPALSMDGTAFFVVDWIVPKNTSQELGIQFMATNQYSGGLTVTLEKVNARDAGGGLVEVKGLPCKALPLTEAIPDNPTTGSISTKYLTVLVGEIIEIGVKAKDADGVYYICIWYGPSSKPGIVKYYSTSNVKDVFSFKMKETGTYTFTGCIIGKKPNTADYSGFYLYTNKIVVRVVTLRQWFEETFGFKFKCKG